jgi:hypothetical protein
MSINKLLFAGIMSVGLLASCAGDETAVTQGTGEPATIKLTLSTGSATTKAGGASGTSLPTTETSGSGETYLNRACVALFDGDTHTSSSTTSNVVTIEDINSPSVSSASPNTITTTTNAKYMLVVANAPSGYFKGITTLYAFLTKAADLGYTISAGGNSTYTKSSYSTLSDGVNNQLTTALPMYSAIQSLNSGNALTANTAYTASAQLIRMVARVAITNITTSFETSGAYSSAVFVPTEIFMYNANTTYNWDNTMPSTASLQTGESTNTSSALSALTDYSYLSSGVLSLAGAAPTTVSATATELVYLQDGLTTSTTINPYFFYVFPNSSSSALSTTNATKIVIKGNWTFGGTTTTMYYPILINHAQTGTSFSNTQTGTDTQIAANTRYSIKATIKSIGVITPSSNIDPASVSLSVTVIPWTDASGQTVVFN